MGVSLVQKPCTMKYLQLAIVLTVIGVCLGTPVQQDQCQGYQQIIENMAIKEKGQQWDCAPCVAEIAGLVASCILELPTGVGLVACVAGALGAGHTCYECVCEVIEY